MFDIFITIITYVIPILIACLATRWVLTRKTVYGYFYLEEVDPESPGEFSIRVSIPSDRYYLDKDQIILKRGKSQE